MASRPSGGRFAGLVALLGATLLPGCGGKTVEPVTTPAPVDLPRPSGGTRISLHVLGQDADATVVSYAEDVERNVRCRPRRAEDGALRCLPDAPDGASVVFTDAECLHAVVPFQRDTCEEAPEYAVDDGAAFACPAAGARVFRMGAEVDPPAALYARLFGACLRQSNVGSPTQGYVEAVPVDPSEWLELERETTPLTDDLGVSFFRGSDGSRLLDGLRLLPSDDACNVEDSDGDTARCIPAVRAYSQSTFVDATCSGRLSAAPACAPTRLIAVDAPPTTCGPTGFLYEIAREVPPDELRLLNGSACAPAPAALLGTQAYFAAGDPVRPGSYPAVTVRHTGDGRLEQLYLADGSGVPLVADGLRDARSGARCNPRTFPDGSVRCVSPSLLALWNGAFRDPDCREPVASVTCQKSPPSAVIVETPGRTACSPRVGELRAVGAPYAGALYALSAGVCGEIGSPQDTLHYEVGDVVDAGTLFPLLRELSQ